MSSSLGQAIATIDELIKQLQSGNLVGTGAPISKAAPPKPAAPPKQPAAAPAPAAKAPKAPKEKKAKAPSNNTSGGAAEGPELFAKAHIAVARVISTVPHPNSDKLYINKLDVGNGVTRQIVAGLQKYVTVDELEGSLPAKLAGELSEGMILASSAPDGSEHVKPLRPDAGSEPGDQVRLEGEEAPDPSSYPKAIKSDHWKKIVAGLKVLNGVATFEAKPFATSTGVVAAVGFPDNSTIS